MTQKHKITKTPKLNVKIDGKKIAIPEGYTVLQAARDAGIYIPTLCHLENATQYGGCRLCIVEIKNLRGYSTACTTPVTENMEIYTKSPELQDLRKSILELLLSEHPYTCLVCKDKDDCKEYMHTTRKVSVATGCNFCPSNGSCELQDLVDYLELKEINFPITYRNIPADNDNPFYRLDYSLCVLCGRCVRACNEVRNSGVLSFVQRGNTAIVGTAFGESQLEAACEYCGACVDVCPTGSIAEKMGAWVGTPDNSVKTSCVFCSIACTMNINSKNNRIINVGPEPGNKSDPLQLCVRGKFIPGDLAHHPERITKPLIKKENKWIEVSWDEAITYTANNLERYRGNQFGIIGSAQGTIEDNYVLQKFSRKVMRSNNVDLSSSYQNKELLKIIHDYYLSFSSPDINAIIDADTTLILGANTSESHPIIEKNIRTAYINKQNVITANTSINRTFDFSNQKIIFKTGEEHNFLLLIISELIKISKSKLGKELQVQLKEFDQKTTLKRSGLTKKEIELLAKSLTKSKQLNIIAGEGLFRNSDGILNFSLLLNIKQLLKNPDNCQIMFLLDEGNRMGATLVGMHPDYLGGFRQIKDKKNIKKWSDIWNVSLSEISGISENEMIENIAEDKITALYIVGNILPHPKLSELKFFVQQNMFLTETSEYANVVFPMPFFAEVDGHILNLEGKLKEVVSTITPPEDVIAPWGVISKISKIISEKGFNYKKTSAIFSEIKQNIELSFTIKEKQSGKQNSQDKIKLNDIKAKSEKHISIETDTYHYHGNPLSSLIPDMKRIMEEGVLFTSKE